MSGKHSTRKVLGLTATAAVALTMVSAGGAHAAGSRSGAAEQVTTVVNGSTAAVPRSLLATTAAASECTFKSYAPNKIALGTGSVKATFSVKATGCTVADWAVGLVPFMNPDDDSSDDGIAYPGRTSLTLSPRKLTNADAGKHDNAVALVAGTNDSATDDYAGGVQPITFLRESTFGSTFNASEPVKKGKAISFKATLTRVNWNGAKTLKYVAYGKAKAQLQFRADGTSSYKTVKTVTGAANGKYSTTVKATKTGRWRLVFAGISTTAPTTSGSDAVKVTS